MNYKQLFLLTMLSFALSAKAFPLAALAPTITSITPEFGPDSSTNPVAVTGDGFDVDTEAYLSEGGPHLVGSYNTPGLSPEDFC